MEKTFGPMMHGFFHGMEEDEKRKMMACFEKMAVMCPCMDMKDMPEQDKRAVMEKMKSFCEPGRE